MTVGVMTRTTRGHTGSPLVADSKTVTNHVAIALVAVLRIGAAF
jgi:uncharacterized protein involved in response to NO